MFRRPLLPLTTYDACSDDSSVGDALRETAGRADFRSSLWVASPALATDVERWLLNPDNFTGQRLENLTLGLLKYCIRASTRATPHAGFAAVGELVNGSFHMPDAAPLHIRADAAFVIRQAHHLTHDPRVVQYLRVQIDPRVHRRGDWLHTPVSILPYNMLSAAVMKAAAQPIPITDLVIEVQRVDPHADLGAVGGLVKAGLLWSWLIPPMTCEDPLAYLIDALGTSIQGLPLAQLYSEFTVWDTVIEEDQPQHIERIVEYAARLSQNPERFLHGERTLSPVSCPIDPAIDNILSAGAHCLARWEVPQQLGLSLERWEAHWRERYGEREVPLLEAIDPVIGIGLPPDYAESLSAQPDPRQVTAMAELACTAFAENSRLLDLADIPPPYEHARLPAAAAAIVTPLRSDTKTVFLLGPEGYVAPPELLWSRFPSLGYPEVLDKQPVQTIFADIYHTVEASQYYNVMLHRPRWDYQIAIGATPDQGRTALSLADLRIGCWGNHWYLRHRDGVIVRATMYHMVTRSLASPLARLLHDISLGDAPAGPRWMWPTQLALPILPELRVGALVVAPARYRLPSALRRRKHYGEWNQALRAWREKYEVPNLMWLLTPGEDDQRLLLNLDCELHCRLLARGAASANIILEAVPAETELGWAVDEKGQRWQCELVLPLRIAPVQHTVMSPNPPSVAAVFEPDAARLPVPGTSPLEFHLYGHTLVRPFLLQKLMAWAQLQGPDLSNWWFVRYDIPSPHLRVRLYTQGRPAVFWEYFNQAAATWQQEGLITHVIMGAYEPEIERYGGNLAYRACEVIFGVSTQVALMTLSLSSPNNDSALMAASIDGLVSLLLPDVWARAHCYRQLFQSVRSQFVREQVQQWHNAFPYLRSALCEAICRKGDHAPKLYLLWEEAQRPATELLEFVVQGSIGRPLEEIIHHLLHMHANRLGLGRDEEHRLVYLLHRACHAVGHGSASQPT